MTTSTPSKRERFIDFEWSVRPIFIITMLLVGGGALLLRLISRLPQAPAVIEPSGGPEVISLATWLAIPAEQLHWPFYALVELFGLGGVDMRYLSAGFALAAIIAMYTVFHTWFNRYYAAIGSLLMLCNTLFLSLALYATPASFVLFYVVLSILAVTLLYRGKGAGYVLGAMTVALSAYVGLVGIIGGILQLAVLVYVLLRKRLSRPDKVMGGVSGVLLLIGIAPALYLVFEGQYMFLHIPSFAIANSVETMKLLSIGSLDNQLLLPHTWPLFDIASFALLILGVAVSINRRKADRYKFLLALFVVSLAALLIGGQDYSLLALFLVPTAVLVTVGLRYLSDVWISVFPKNKAATIIAHSASVAIVAIICLFHVLRFSSLLPQLPEYQQAFEPQSSGDAVQYSEE